jgi:hypothetical protein
MLTAHSISLKEGLVRRIAPNIAITAALSSLTTVA